MAKRPQTTSWEDTLLAHHAVASHLPKSLSHVVSIFCDFEPWKILAGKGAGEAKGLAPWEKDPAELLKYNAQDVVGTALAWQRIQPDLASERHVYESDTRIALMCGRMAQIGIGFDASKQKELSQRLRARKRGLLGEMRRVVGDPSWHPAKLTDVRAALFEQMGAPLLKPTATGLASTNNETLEYLRVLENDAGKLADRILRWRAAGKTLGSYVDNVPVGRDGHVHPDWRLGPVTGRLASWIMTLPRYGDDFETQVRAMYVARPKSFCRTARLIAQIHDAAIFEVAGRLVYFDLSQCEARLAAYFSGDKNLIQACELDIHTENAKIIFSDSPDAAKRLARANEKSTFTDNNVNVLKWKNVLHKHGGCKEERDVSKSIGF